MRGSRAAKKSERAPRKPHVDFPDTLRPYPALQLHTVALTGPATLPRLPCRHSRHPSTLHVPPRWLVSQVDSVFGPLNARVQEEAAVVKAEELRKKKEREETARRMKEERLRRLEEEKMQSAVGASPSHQPNALAALPNQIESPGGKAFGGAAPASAGGAPPMETSSAPAAGGGPLRDFSDLQHPDQGAGISAAVGGATAMAGQSRMALHAAPSGTPPRPPARRDSLGRGDPAESAHASVEMSGAAAQQRPNSASNRSSDNGGRRSGSGTGSFANKVAPEPLSGSLPIGQSHSPLG